MRLKIVTPERVVLEESDIEAVYAHTIDGDVGILPKHVPLVTPLDISVLRYVKAGQKEPVAVMGGVLRTNGKVISVLTNAAELSGEIDVARAQQAKERAEAELRQETAQTDFTRAKLALMRSLVRLKLSSPASK